MAVKRVNRFISFSENLLRDGTERGSEAPS